MELVKTLDRNGWKLSSGIIRIGYMRSITFIFSVIICIFTVSTADAHQHLEKWYQDKWCKEQKGKAEFKLPDKTRCDCLTETHAIEFDFGPKWAEAIGQSLYYALQTGKKAGIVLILETEGEYKFFIRLNTVIQTYKLPLDVWVMKSY